MAALTGCGGMGGGSDPNSNLTQSSGGGNSTSTPPPPPPTFQSSVKHIILFMQENRSFDHYFGELDAYRVSKGLGADVDDLSKAGNISLVSWDNSGNISPFKMNTACIGDLSSSWVEAHVDIDRSHASNPGSPPPMDGFAYTAGGFAAHDPAAGGFDTTGKRAMGYYDGSQLPFYYWAATQFGTSDRWFSAAPARTQINRMYFLAATSNGYAFPGGPDGHPELNMGGVKNIFELLQDAGVTWKVYVTDGFVAGKSIGSTYMTYFSGFTNAHTDHFADAKTFATDAANDALPSVSLIESGYIETGQDEHPLNPIDKGARYAQQLVTALMNSPSWANSVMFITYDEGGGLYDHVPPMQTVNPDGKPPYLAPGDPKGDFTISGFRVPLMVISPFAKPGYVSHTPADFTALLKFIEDRFGLPNLNKRDAFQPDMTEYFDWTGPNLNSTSPPSQPALPCYFDHLP
ncbi:MAG TPA: alkaline phosphatase family protein [Terriglobales bacterium]|nr:alkaline phosphatase family protein [Terriglobales bacterium]